MKIFLETYDSRYKDRIRFIDTIKEDLEDRHNIIFVEEATDCDLFLSQQISYAPRLEECFEQGKDVIILEVNDTASIFEDSLRKAIKNPQVKGFFKVTNFKDLSCHNEPTSGDFRYHANFINKIENVCEQQRYETLFTDAELEKIKCAMPAFLNFRMDPVRTMAPLSNERKIGANFAGTTDYTKNKNYVNLDGDDPKLNLPKLMQAHRKRAVDAIVSLHRSGMTCVLSDHKPMSQPEYWSSLYNTKACISPWGFGAYNWRDYEAIYLGALLVKPNTDFLETYCDLFRAGENYIACSHDFSDLFDIVTRINADWNGYSEVRKNALRLLGDHSNIRKISDRFVKQIMESIEG